MGHPYMPLFTGDLERDTCDLSALEFGIYLRLLIHAWNNHGKIPLKKSKLLRITRCDPRLWSRYGEPVINRFWQRDSVASCATQKRLTSVLTCSDENLLKNKARAAQPRSVDGRYTKPKKNRDLFYSEPRGDLLSSEIRAKPIAPASAELKQIVSSWSNGNGQAG